MLIVNAPRLFNIAGLFAVLSLLAASCANAGGAGAAFDSGAPPVRILFIGNSLTYYNDLPGVLERIVNSEGSPQLETSMIATGGATLEQHWSEGLAVREIRRGGWDFVVLQEQSQLGAAPAAGSAIISPEGFHAAVRLFNGEIRGAGACTALFLTWAHKDKPREQSLLDEAYQSIARELGAVVAPAGPAWSKARMNGAGGDLYEDNVHASFSGTYLAALTIGAALVPGLLDGESAQRAGFVIASDEYSGAEAREEGVSPSTVERLKRAARTAVEEWREQAAGAGDGGPAFLSPECAARQAAYAPPR